MVFPPTLVVALNRAVALAEVEGTQAALTIVDDLDLDDYYLFHAVRADLLGRMGRTEEAAAAYEAAMGSTGNAAEVDLLREKQATLETPA